MNHPTKPTTTAQRKAVSLIQQTWKTPYVTVRDGIVYKKFSYPEYHHTDGIGTKGIYHWRARSFKNAVLDALAMNLNDLVVVGATPYALINHILLPKKDNKAFLAIVRNLVKECKKRKIVITGGETAIHPNMEELEISITMLGFVKKPQSNRFVVGDVLIGIASNGLHSNGFFKIREIFGLKKDPAFIAPTQIYLDSILSLDARYNIHGMAHVTGGAFAKLKNSLIGTDIFIHRDHSLKPHGIFKKIYAKGVLEREMYTFFNCGIGFVLSVPPKHVNDVLLYLNEEHKSDVIGEVIAGTGKVKIESMFSKKLVEF